MKGFLYYGLVAVFLLCGCNKSDKVPGPQYITVAAPANFPPMPSFPDNPMSKEGVALGRLLFYDKRLSGNNMISCASCHFPEKAFSDGVALGNAGMGGTQLHRHAPALINMAWANNGLFWDGGSTNLESQAFGPLAAADEMHQNLSELTAELNAIPDYVNRFRFLFNDEIRSAYVVRALAQFQRTFISSDSRYDKYVRGETGGTLTDLEKQGRAIVQQKCQGCHSSDLFTDNDFHNNGMDDDFSNTDLEGLYQGRFRITYQQSDLGKFKTPTLRNVMVTAPYMHDGRFASIDDVLNHYNSGIKESATLDEKVKQAAGNKPGIPLTGAEKQALIAFLHTLTDKNFLNNQQLSAP